MKPKYAGFWIRWVASGIDGLLVMVVSWLAMALVLVIVYQMQAMQIGREAMPPLSDAFSSFWVQIAYLGLYSVLTLAYATIAHARWGTTIGKKTFRIYVGQYKEPSAFLTLNQSFLRAVGYFVSYVPFCAGYLMAAVHPEKRALHDLMAGSVSIRKD